VPSPDARTPEGTESTGRGRPTQAEGGSPRMSGSDLVSLLIARRTSFTDAEIAVTV
jgi:hypothetical protein